MHRSLGIVLGVLIVTGALLFFPDLGSLVGNRALVSQVHEITGWLVPIPLLLALLSRAFRRDVAMQYVHELPKGFSCVTTLTMSFLGNGYSVGFLPIEYFPRAGRSKFHWLRDTRRYVLQVIRMTLSYNPLKVFLPIGLVLLGLGFVKLGFDWAERDFRLAANTLLIFFAALQVITVGLVADLVVRATKSSSTVPPA